MAFEGAGLELAYRSHARRLHAVAYHVLHDRHEAEDAVQAALLRVWSSGSYQPERGPLLPFLIACVRREALDIVRGSKRRAEREGTEPEQEPPGSTRLREQLTPSPPQTRL